MTTTLERRGHPRLCLCYPIRIAQPEDGAERTLGRTVTRDLSARGAYFQTYDGHAFEPGAALSVVVTVPHKLSSGGGEVLLDLRGTARVVRVDGPERLRTYGEDGMALAGVALEFTAPLSFHYCWV